MDALVVETYRLYGAGDCAALRANIERADLSTARPEHRAVFDLLIGFCAERDGEILSAKHRYSAVIAGSPRSFQAYEAALRLRELERLEKTGITREELKKRADAARQSPLYQHDTMGANRRMPDYPTGPSAAGVEGSVLLDFAITRDGGVTDLVVLESQPPFLFEGAALAAVRNWNYRASDSEESRRAMVRFPFEIERPRNSLLVAPRVDESTLDPIERRGREIFQDVVATGRARDALQRAGYLTSLRSWITIPGTSGYQVRFLDDQGRAIADVVVDVFSTEVEQVTIHESPIALPVEHLVIWRARTDALALAKTRAIRGCTESYSTAVLPSLDPNRSWDVYVLSVPPDWHTVPAGGHYRISISRDPGVAPELHPFAESCALATPSPDSERLLITESLSKTPTEVEVFLNLRSGRALGVVVDDDTNGLWYIDNGRMRRAQAETKSSR
jgi:TonB family protein